MLDSLGDLRSIRWSFWRRRISDFSLLRVDLLIRPISRHITITSREATRLLPSCILGPRWSGERGGRFNLYEAKEQGTPCSSIEPIQNRFLAFRTSPSHWHSVERFADGRG